MYTKSIIIVFKLLLTLMMAIVVTPDVSAQIDFDPDSYTDEGTFNQILEPVLRIYSFGKYAASLIAVMVLLLAGINYMVSGNNPQKREQAKYMASYVFVGLFVIWAAPYAINLMV